jgi:RNA polymerase sigma-70 factor (ECF subfamily)
MERFRHFYNEHRDKLFGYLLRKSGNHAVAADLVQESFTRYLERYRCRELNLGLLFTIGRNLFYDHVRQQRPCTDAVPETQTTAVDEEQAYIQREDSRQILSALQQLDDDDRDILALVVSSGMTYKEIAAIRGCTEAAIKVRVHRARQKLRQLLLEEEE